MKSAPSPTTDSNSEACEASFVCRSALDEILRRGAERMLASAIELEVQQYIAEHAACLDESGRRLVARNGRLPQRQVQTAAGPMEVRQPRVNDRREGKRFVSSILPPYARRSPFLDCLIPLLYLKGVSTNAMPEALEPLLGEGAKGLSASNVSRLAESWIADFEAWNARDLSGKNYVYLWADGVYFNVRLSDDRSCMLVVVGSLPDGTKEVVGILLDGERESKLSWKGLLLDLRKRGMAEAPRAGGRRLGLLVRPEGGLPRSPPSEALGPQDRQRPGQAAQEAAMRRQEPASTGSTSPGPARTPKRPSTPSSSSTSRRIRKPATACPATARS